MQDLDMFHELEILGALEVKQLVHKQSRNKRVMTMGRILAKELTLLVASISC
jgi:hypothetical protein